MSSTPNHTYMSQFISDGQKATLSGRKFFDTMLVGSTDRPDHIYRAAFGDFFLRHWNQLKVTSQYYVLPQEMFYQPKTLSLMLYGTTELWLGLLRINGMKNITEFHYPVILIYNPSEVKELINIFFKREGQK